MEIEEAFQDAMDRVKTLNKQPSHVQLKLYGLFKQASKGDVTGSRPGRMDIRGRAKYDAWASRKGLDMEDAKMEYVEFAEELGA